MKLLVINNLASGFGEGSVYDFIRSFARDGDEVCVRSTDGTTDVRDLLGDAEAFDAVVASGGDGTVATVSYRLANTGVPILPFPAGTANLLAANLASPMEPHALAKLVREERTLDERARSTNAARFSWVAIYMYEIPCLVIRAPCCTMPS